VFEEIEFSAMHHSNHTHSIVPERLFGDDITNTTYPSEGRPLPPCFQRTQGKLFIR